MANNPMSCIHIGMPKTATTTLQRYVYPFHSEVFYLGKFYPPKAFHLNAEVERLLSEITDGDPGEKRLSELGSDYQALTSSARESGKIPVWSDELVIRTSHDNLRRRAQRFRAVFGESKVLITIRNPISFVKSLYLHMITTYQIDRSRWLNQTLARGYAQKPFFLTMEQWLDRIGFSPNDESTFGVDNFVDIASIAEIFSEQFGGENVGVFLFERMIEDMPAFLREVCQFIDIDADQALSGIQGRRSAGRVSQQTVESFVKICASPWRSTLFRYAPQAVRNWMTQVSGNTDGQPTERADIEVPEEWKKKIEQVSIASAERLLQRWPIPLKHYGYLH